MLSLLDSIIDNFQGGVTVLDENHGTNNSGECHQLDASTGRVALMVAGEMPWHKLGVRVDRAATSAEAIRLASLDWQVAKMPLSYQFNGTNMVSPGAFGVVRQDTGACLGNVGGKYEPLQNADAFEFLDGILARHGARYETAGALYDGRKVFMLANIAGKSFKINGQDQNDSYLMLANSHDGSSAVRVFPTSVRVVCRNTYRAALNGSTEKGLSIRHTGSMTSKIKAAELALARAVDGLDQYKEHAEVLARTALPSIRNYANDVLDAVLDVTAAQASKGAGLLAATIATTQAEMDLAAKSFARKIERRGEILNDIIERYHSETCGNAGGTAWYGFNAVTESADHMKMGRSVGTQNERNSRRFESIIDGDRDEMKQEAMSIALQLAR